MIKLYTQTGCPLCELVEEELDKKKVAYERITDLALMQSLGFTTTPVGEIDGEYYKGKTLLNYIKSL